MNAKDAVYRCLRTFLQAFIGTFLALLIAPGTAEVPTLDGLQRAGLAALFAGCVALLSFVQNFLEDNELVPAFLKEAPGKKPPG